MDHTGNVIAALSQKIGSTQSIEMAKALASRRAVIFARELSLFNVIIKGDCLRVLQALNCVGHCQIMFSHIINETKRLGGMLQKCQFQHVGREGNRLAHNLAIRAVLYVDIDVWVKDLPKDLDDIFQFDLDVCCRNDSSSMFNGKRIG